MENYQVINLLEYYLQDCGYKAKKARRKNIEMAIYRNDELIGELTCDRKLIIQEPFACEKEKLEGIAAFVFTYAHLRHSSFMGQKCLIDFDDTVLGVYLNRETGAHTFYVYNAFHNFKSCEEMEKFAYANIDEAKEAFIRTIAQSLSQVCDALNDIHPDTSIQYRFNFLRDAATQRPSVLEALEANAQKSKQQHSNTPGHNKHGKDLS